ncbi:unnamed protein product, partial [Staurois parvus]
MDPIMSIMRHVLPFCFLHVKPGTDCIGVPGPFEYTENALHAFLMKKKGSGQHLDMDLKKKR